jgi:hypothetical protein
MISKTILAVAAAAALSAGAMAVSTSAADAHGGGYYSNVCSVAYHTIIVGYDYYNNPIYKQVPYQYCHQVFVPYTYSYHSYGYSYGGY